MNTIEIKTEDGTAEFSITAASTGSRFKWDIRYAFTKDDNASGFGPVRMNEKDHIDEHKANTRRAHLEWKQVASIFTRHGIDFKPRPHCPSPEPTP